jgi:hypothetical protein
MKSKPYWNPYFAGVMLGLVLLITFLVAAQGLGASAFPKRLIALWAADVDPEWTARNAALGSYVAGGAFPLRNWIFVEVIGVILGGSPALSAGRFKVWEGPASRAGPASTRQGGTSWGSRPAWRAAARPVRRSRAVPPWQRAAGCSF